jgi:hypothetical protein
VKSGLTTDEQTRGAAFTRVTQRFTPCLQMAVEGRSSKQGEVGVMVGSAGRNRAIVIGLAGVMLGVLLGFSITTFAVSADEHDAAATGSGRGAGLVDPWLFEAPLEHDAAATGSGRGAGLVDPSLFEGPIEHE